MKIFHLLLFLPLILIELSVSGDTSSESSNDAQSAKFKCKHGRKFDHSLTTYVGNIVLNTNKRHRIGSGGFGNVRN
ncbi:hypothetical protein ACQ4LE_009156 [Meloidogyne hapla]